jgi:hypothetical protein
MADVTSLFVMAGPAEGRDPAIRVLSPAKQEDVDGRDKHGHDVREIAMVLMRNRPRHR